MRNQISLERGQLISNKIQSRLQVLTVIVEQKFKTGPPDVLQGSELSMVIDAKAVGHGNTSIAHDRKADAIFGQGVDGKNLCEEDNFVGEPTKGTKNE